MTSQHPLFRPLRLDAPVCRLGEGPSYDPHSDTAWWFDILECRLFEHTFSDGVTRMHPLPSAASALARIDARRQLLFMEDGLHIRDTVSGTLGLHLPLEADNRATRSNDARVHPSGAFWLSTMGREAQPGAGAIYHYRAGKVQRLFDGITISNAICFSPDGSVGYYADTALRRVMRCRLNPHNGLPLAAPEIFLANFPAGTGPDGAVTDAEGNLWIALWGGGQIAGYAPDGRKLPPIPVPASQVSCPAFAGSRAQTMLVTSAATGLPDAPNAHDASGGTFILALPWAGKFEPDVAFGEAR